jgi:hypothetical protein
MPPSGRIVNGQKQGGNVASYFTLPELRELLEAYQ